MPTNKDLPESLTGFAYIERFPDAGVVFSGKPVPLDEMLRDGIVFVDTNVLLMPYELAPKSLATFTDLLQKLKDRGQLRVAGHVAREFAANRGARIRSMLNGLKIVVPPELLAGIPPLTDHPALISLKEKLSKLRAYPEWAEVREHYQTLAEAIKGWHWNDPVTNAYRDLLSKEVLVDVDLSSPQARSTVQEEFQRRVAAGGAPGTSDARKGNGNEIGDFIIWKSILLSASTTKRHTLFLTNDQKQDWVENKLYTRFDLIAEHMRVSEGKQFRVITPGDLARARKSNPDFVSDLEIAESKQALWQELARRAGSDYPDRVTTAYWSDLVGSVAEALSQKWRPDQGLTISPTPNGLCDFEVHNEAKSSVDYGVVLSLLDDASLGSFGRRLSADSAKAMQVLMSSSNMAFVAIEGLEYTSDVWAVLLQDVRRILREAGSTPSKNICTVGLARVGRTLEVRQIQVG